jgi:hypothetical protein
MNLYGIQPDEITVYWPYILPLLAKPFVRMELLKDYDPSYVLGEVKAKRMQCWIAHANDKIDAVFVTQIISHPKRKILTIPYVGAETGTIDTWIDAMDTFKAFAIEHGCAAIRGWGRKGWEKVLKPDSVRIEFDIEVA